MSPHPRATAPRCSGFTLLELLVVLAIVAVATVAAAPSFTRNRDAAVASAAANALLATLHHARGIALLRATPTVVCLSEDASQCLALEVASSRGWIEFQNDRVESPPRRDAAEPLLSHTAFDADLSIRGTRRSVTFWPVSRSGTTTTFTICAGRPASAARAVIVSQSGRPRLKSLTPLSAGCLP